jgi:hypothetical protein
MDLLYLDYNCFQRLFDDPLQIRIRLESMACEAIFDLAKRRKVNLVWSFMHDDENLLCPFADRKREVMRLASLCQVRVSPDEQIYDLAKSYQRVARLSAKDAVHLACASSASSLYFITCDDELMKRAARLNLRMKVMNPIDYVRGPN